jgi:hypothetical protein
MYLWRDNAKVYHEQRLGYGAIRAYCGVIDYDRLHNKPPVDKKLCLGCKKGKRLLKRRLG